MQNRIKLSIKVSEYEIKDKKIPKTYNGFTIIQISDLHNNEFGIKEERLINIIKEQAPDIIVITGDLIDSRYTDVAIAMDFITSAVEIAPVYYVTGNHECRCNAYQSLKEQMESVGVIICNNKAKEINKNGDVINLVGLDDQSLKDETLSHIMKNLTNENYTILLAHQPEYIKFYNKFNVDLVFCGHAHGGQIRLPLIGGLFAPNQGIFPKYTSGVYEMNGTKMVVSRGLGNRVAVPRIFNKPDVVKVVLRSEFIF